MTLYYLDASAWVKRYSQERGSGWVRSLLRQQGLLFASATLGFIEVSAALTRKQKAGEIQSGGWRKHSRADWDRFLHVELSRAVVETAIQLLEHSPLRGADATHLASSVELRNHLQPATEEFVFVASDRELKQAAHTASLKVIDPEEQA
ncbi:MAG: type II toxin-antitoxin system VapC family toxin [Acidobacteria bacterium]|nr:type II toxin-antitoxin system VapC family toxin [Acidobacteriota bacterium]